MAAENVGAVSGRVHPAIDHALRGSITDGEILAGSAVPITTRADPLEWFLPVRSYVSKVTVIEHVVHTILGRERKLPIQTESRKTVRTALAVHGVDQSGDAVRRIGNDRRRSLRSSGPHFDLAPAEGTLELAREGVKITRAGGTGSERCAERDRKRSS